MPEHEYTPSDVELRTAWQQYATATDACYGRLREDDENPSDEFDRWLLAHDAKVKRDAAREALDGYAAAEEDNFLSLHAKGAPISAAQCTHAAMTAREYRDAHCPTPETEDQT